MTTSLALSSFATETERDDRYAQWVSSDGHMTPGMTCLVGPVLYEWTGSRWMHRHDMVTDEQMSKAAEILGGPLARRSYVQCSVPGCGAVGSRGKS